ncbi:hypothetical protein E5673_14770 [Sphingomonas sp. PAMC26645]|uniref:hypothetical protein n=1 Tax=Sphingomonas sp. PAMC26645 TaxID=2565555 RepID=UPI00109DFCF2|nr:hypothetical protein [Sphingomonas sp. PAMC26645]QCB43332.1 hypothetical protein E5673_14770 [Sphingomonas sp. PAMC26645]
MIKKTLKTGSSGSAGRVLVTSNKRSAINPGPSKEAMTKIERFEASSSRAEQRLGLIRLA